MTNGQLDYIQECIERLVEDNKKHMRGTTNGKVKEYFEGKVDAYETALYTLNNARSLFDYEQFKIN